MTAPITFIDYIVVHELCHIHQRDHTDAFWNEVDKVIPDYLERREWLKRCGARLSLQEIKCLTYFFLTKYIHLLRNVFFAVIDCMQLFITACN